MRGHAEIGGLSHGHADFSGISRRAKHWPNRTNLFGRINAVWRISAGGDVLFKFTDEEKQK
jgi:hypothetical protein